MSEEFFERLRKRADEKYQDPNFDILCDHWTAGIRATIKALKEIMVGEPKKGTLRHRPWYQNTGLSTDIDTGEDILCWDIQKHGTDGEEVVVLVVRYSKP